MKFNTYLSCLASCIAGDHKLNCAYLLYKKVGSDTPTVTSDLRSDSISNLVTEQSGVARSTSVLIQGMDDDRLSFTITSTNAEPVGSTSLPMSSDTCLYGVILAARTEHTAINGVYPSDMFLTYHEVKESTIPTGADLAITVNLKVGGN